MQIRPVQLPVRGQVVPGVGIGGTAGIDVRQVGTAPPSRRGRAPAARPGSASRRRPRRSRSRCPPRGNRRSRGRWRTGSPRSHGHRPLAIRVWPRPRRRRAESPRGGPCAAAPAGGEPRRSVRTARSRRWRAGRASAFSSREQRRNAPLASTRVNATTSSTIGPRPSTRPCTFEESAPPSVSRSAPVCFWMMPQGCGCPSWVACSQAISAGHMMPASASTSPRSGSKSSTRSSPVMSSRSSSGAELLSAHGVTAAGDGDGATRGACREHRVAHICPPTPAAGHAAPESR